MADNKKQTTIKKTQSNRKRTSTSKKGGPGRKPTKKKLTEKQKRFIHEYLKEPNATQAALNAGYSKKTAHAIGHENLKKLENEIQAEVEKKDAKKIAHADEVLQFFTSVMRGEVEEEQIVIEGAGDGYSKAIKMNKQASAKDRIKAAENLAKRYGLFTDRVEITSGKEDDAIGVLINELSDRQIVGVDDE